MFGIDTLNSNPTMPATQPAGTSGFFKAGDPLSGVAPTPMNVDWPNIITAEIQACLAAASIVQNKRDSTQLYQSIVKIATAIANTAIGGMAAEIATLLADIAALQAEIVAADAAIASLSTFAQAGVVPIGTIAMFNGTAAPLHWQICDGTNNTPDLRDRFIVGAGLSYTQWQTGGSAGSGATGPGGDGITSGTALTVAQLPPHTHEYFTGTGEWTQLSGFPANAQNPGPFQTILTQSTGSGGTHNHETPSHTHPLAAGSLLPPFYALIYIIRIS